MRHLGRYRLVERLGAGAFATVWLAHDDELDVPVAVKVLADNWSSNADIRERFLGEARLLRRISDPRVVRVHDIGAVGDDQPYFVMDYVEGGTLAEVVAHPPPPAQAVELAVQTAYAVQVLHDHAIVHRDVKPSNLLLGRDERGGPRVLVTDLGMAKSLAEASGLTVTAGTPAYMAPEQVQGSDGFDARADVYAVAAVSHALLTGRPPFAVQGLQDVVHRPADVGPDPLPATLGLSPAVDDLLAASLAKDPDRRPASAREFGDRLRAAASDDGGATHVVLPATGKAPARAWSGWLVGVWSAAAFLAFLAGTYAVLTLR